MTRNECILLLVATAVMGPCSAATSPAAQPQAVPPNLSREDRKEIVSALGRQLHDRYDIARPGT